MDQIRKSYGTGSVQWGEHKTHEVEPYKEFYRREEYLDLIPNVDILNQSKEQLSKLQKDIYSVRSKMFQGVKNKFGPTNDTPERQDEINEIDNLWSQDKIKIVNQLRNLQKQQKGGKKHYTRKKKINNRLSKKCRKCKSNRRISRHNCKKLNKRTRTKKRK